MADLILEDARSHIFPLFLVTRKGENDVELEGRAFLGTAFFVTPKGDAVSAAHVIPPPKDIPEGKVVVAVVQEGDKQLICFISHVAVFPNDDFCLIHLVIEQSKFLEVSDQVISAGTDIQMIGIPSHEVWMKGKEMRMLKGHVSMSGPHLELNIAIPPGMSGSPVFVGSAVVAFASKSIKSEEVEDYSEEIIKLTDTKEQIVITKVTRATHYGLALPFSRYTDTPSPVFGGRTLMQLIAYLKGNAEPDAAQIFPKNA